MEIDYGPQCPECQMDLDWEDCDNCCDGYTHHDCGEDTCCCLYPEDNVRCDICEGSTGWWRCYQNKCGTWLGKELTAAHQDTLNGG